MKQVLDADACPWLRFSPKVDACKPIGIAITCKQIHRQAPHPISIQLLGSAAHSHPTLGSAAVSLMVSIAPGHGARVEFSAKRHA